MKRLIVCCDGTWNTPDEEENNLPAATNVVRLYNALAPQDARGCTQLAYYHTGVGTSGGFFSRLAGGMYGAGLDQNIVSAFVWLGAHYEDDGEADEIFVFGFSRGAYTVRSLASMIGYCGLPIINRVPSAEDWDHARLAFREG